MIQLSFDAFDDNDTIPRNNVVAPPKPIWVFDDGGREAAGYQRAKSGRAGAKLSRAGHKVSFGDCVIRAIAIATQIPYERVHRELWDYSALPSDPAVSGVCPQHYKPWLLEQGWQWIPTMGIGTGCRVHLRRDELPSGRLAVAVSGHLTAVVDGVIHDLYDPSREGTRCVYGYFRRPA